MGKHLGKHNVKWATLFAKETKHTSDGLRDSYYVTVMFVDAIYNSRSQALKKKSDIGDAGMYSRSKYERVRPPIARVRNFI